MSIKTRKVWAVVDSDDRIYSVFVGSTKKELRERYRYTGFEVVRAELRYPVKGKEKKG